MELSREPQAPGWTDQDLIEHLRRFPGSTASRLAEAAGVTTTAIRQRLARLLSQGLVERASRPEGRGRPTHEYRLTLAGVRSAGNNYQALAQVLWDEVRSIDDVVVKRGLLGRLAGRMASIASKEISGDNLGERMESLASFMRGRGMAFTVEKDEAFPVLTALACPYPDLAERDRGICAMEKMAFSDILGDEVKLSQCRLDGSPCCTFESTAGREGPVVLG